MGESSTVKAQRLANEANVSNTNATNETNVAIAESANRWNWANLQAQNEWNIQQWERENAYNDPSAQMERYIKAGINPLFALGGMDAGNAQHLESGAPPPAEVAHLEAPHVNPEYDPYVAQHIANINTSARDLVNGVQGFMQLGQSERDVSTREKVGQSQIGFNKAAAAEKHATAIGREIENNWNLATFDVRSRSESQKLFNMQKQYDKMDSETEEAKAKKLEIDASRDLIRQQTDAVLASIRQRDRELDIMSQNAQSNRINAEANASNAQTNAGQLKLAGERFNAEIKKWNNDSLMQYLYKFGRTVTGSVSASAGVDGLGIKGSAGLRETSPADLEKFKSCGLEIISRYGNDPSEKNQKDAAEAAKIIELIQNEQQRRQVIPVDQLFNSTDSMIFNPSDF